MTDLKLAFRSLRATPIVSVVAILSLALGIGANTAIFSLVNSLLLRALPVKEPAQLALVTDDAETAASPRGPTRSGNRSARRRDLFDGAFAWSTTRFNLAAGGETQFVDGIWASGGMFDTLGVPAMLGRTFTAADDARGGGTGRPGGGHQLQLLAAPVRRRGRRARPAPRARTRSVHDHRRHRPRLLRPRRRPRVRRRRSRSAPSRSSAARNRRSTALDVVADRDGAAETRPVGRLGHRGDPRRPAADPRGDDAAGLERQGRRGLSQGEVHARAGRHRQLAAAQPLRTSAPHAPRRRRPGAADRVREHREPAARARDGAAPRAERARRARRVALAARAAAAVREPGARGQRRGGRHADRVVGQPAARAPALDADQHRVPRSLARLARAGVHDRRHRRDGAALRHRAGAARVRRRADGGAEGARTRRVERRAPASPAASSSRRSRCR